MWYNWKNWYIPSRLMPTAMHFLRRQYWQRFLLIRRMLHCWFLVQGLYWIFCWMLLRKKPCESPTKPSSVWPSLSDDDSEEQLSLEREVARSFSHKHPMNSFHTIFSKRYKIHTSKQWVSNFTIIATWKFLITPDLYQAVLSLAQSFRKKKW